METFLRKSKIFACVVFYLPFLILGCSKDNRVAEKSIQNERASVKKARGADQLSGVGFLATNTECNSPSQGATYAVKMTGDLVGCLFTYVDQYKCSPSGTYLEVGREYFVGTYKGEPGTF